MLQVARQSSNEVSLVLAAIASVKAAPDKGRYLCMHHTQKTTTSQQVSGNLNLLMLQGAKVQEWRLVICSIFFSKSNEMRWLHKTSRLHFLQVGLDNSQLCLRSSKYASSGHLPGAISNLGKLGEAVSREIGSCAGDGPRCIQLVCQVVLEGEACACKAAVEACRCRGICATSWRSVLHVRTQHRS